MKKRYSKPVISKKNLKLIHFSRANSLFDPLSDLLATCQTCTGTIRVGSCSGCGNSNCSGGNCVS